MTPRTKLLGCLGAALLTSCGSLLAANNEWRGDSGDWFAGPWQLGTAPTSVDSAIFSLNASSLADSIIVNIGDEEAATAAYLHIGRGKSVELTLGSGASLTATGGTWQIGSGVGTAPASSPGALKLTGPTSGSATIAVGAGGINVGSSAAQVGNLLEFSGNLNVSAGGGIVVGRFGNGNLMTIGEGAKLNGTTLWVSATQNVTNGIGDHNSVLITGADTEVTLNPTSNLALLVAARPTTGLNTQQTGNHVRVEDGATLRVDGASSPTTADLKIGDTSYRVGNYVSVTGSGSLLELKNNTRISIGANSASSYNNYLSVSAGGVIRNDGTTTILNPRSTGGKNRVVVGTGGTLLIGDDFTNTGGLLQLDDGGVLRGEHSSHGLTPVNVFIEGHGTSVGRFEAAGTGLASNVNATIRSGGVLAVGSSQTTVASTFTLSSTVTIEEGGALDLRIYSDGGMDSIHLAESGSLVLQPGAVLNLTLDDNVVQSGDSWTLFTGDVSNIVGDFDLSLSSLPDLTGDLYWDVSRLNAAGGWQVTAIPEPSTYVLLLTGGALGIGAYRRARRKE